MTRPEGLTNPLYSLGAKLLVVCCKTRYVVLFQIWTFSSRPEDEAHIGPTATYDDTICLGFQYDITTLQLQGYNISYNRHITTLIQYISGRYICMSTDYNQMPSGKEKRHRSHDHT